MTSVERVELSERIFDALRPAMTPPRAAMAQESWDVGEQTEAVAMALDAAILCRYTITDETADDIRTLAAEQDSPSSRHLLPWLAELLRVTAA